LPLVQVLSVQELVMASLAEPVQLKAVLPVSTVVH